MLFYLKRYDEAQAQTRKVLEMEPRFTVSRVVVAWGLLEKREYEAAVRETEKAFELGPDPEAEVNLAITYAVVRRRDEARTLLTKLQKRSVDLVSVGIAQGYAWSGDKDGRHSPRLKRVCKLAMAASRC